MPNFDFHVRIFFLCLYENFCSSEKKFEAKRTTSCSSLGKSFFPRPRKKCLAMATVPFSHFYKIPFFPKVTKFIFYNTSSSLLTLSSNFILVQQKYFCFEKKIFFQSETKNDQKKLNLKNWKSPKIAKYQDLGFSTFQIQIFVSVLVSHQNIFSFLTANILLSYQKKIFGANSINRKEDIL